MSYYPDSEARTDPQLRFIQRAERGAAARARQSQRWRRIAVVAGLALALLAVPFAARSWAWTAAVQPIADCKGTTFNGTVGNEPGSHTATVKFGGESKSVTVPAQGGNSFALHFASHAGGPWSYKGTWSESSEVETASGTLSAVRGCQPPPPPPPPPPPVKQGSAGVTTTCSSVTFNFTGASAGVEQYAKVDGKIKRPASLNGSVTFKGLAPGEHPSEYGSGSNVQRGSFEALDCTPTEKKGDDFAGTATDLHRAGPPDQHGPPSPEVGTPPVDTPTPGNLPFTGPRDWLLPVGLALFVAGAAMVLAGRRTHQRMLRSIEPSRGVRGWSLDRDSADTNLLMTLFHRFHR